MASPDKSVPFTFEGERYLLVFNNMGRAVAEETLNMEWPEIGAKMDATGPGPRLQAALLFGATRKHHRRDFPNLPSVYNFLDRVDEAEEEEAIDYTAALMAAFYRGEKEVWRKILSGEDLEEEEAEEEDPKEEPKKSRQRKKKSTNPESSDSETGTDS